MKLSRTVRNNRTPSKVKHLTLGRHSDFNPLSIVQKPERETSLLVVVWNDLLNF